MLAGGNCPVDGESQLDELTIEFDRDLVVLIVHWRAGIGANIEIFVPLQDQGNGVFHGLCGHGFAINLEDARSTAADAAGASKGKRAHAEPVVLEIKLDGVLTGR